MYCQCPECGFTEGIWDVGDRCGNCGRLFPEYADGHDDDYPDNEDDY